jgi:hypothetical protein
MSVVLKRDTKSHVHNSTRRTGQAPPSRASTLYVVAVTAVTAILFGLILWAALVNAVGPPFSP